MSMARHHSEWLSLIETSGPFLSLPVLMRAFPQGLDAHDPECHAELRMAFEEWEANNSQRKPDIAIHNAWIGFVLENVLGFEGETLLQGQAVPPGCTLRLGEYGETLIPDFVVVDPPGVSRSGKPRMLIQAYPFTQNLERSIPHKHWQASPSTRMMELLHASDVPLGLITNGEKWTLVHAPVGETTGYASWYASLWVEEPLTFRAFRSLMSRERFFNRAKEDTLVALLKESAQDQHEVTTQLGFQVRKAVEVLIRSLDLIDHERGRQLLDGVEEKVVYEGALTVMMRLVFLFCAEERGLLLLGDPLYDQHYAVSTLRDQLRQDADRFGEEVLERRFDGWSRLLSTFRAVHAGVNHEAMALPAYGGTLFDPDRFPFLEGRPLGSSWTDTPAKPLPIDNRTTLHLLEALQMLQVKVPGGGPVEARRLSFRALDIEQIGHVYEGLLDHTAVRAAPSRPVIGLFGSKKGEFEVEVATLEDLYCTGEEALIAFLREKTGKSEQAIQRALQTEEDDLWRQRLLSSCGNDGYLFKTVLPFAGLIRDDTFGRPVIIPGGGIYVTAGQERRSTGTHYTPRSLTESIVQHTLEPLVFEGPAEGKPREEWTLRTAGEILDLKICDMAMGSGAFLVQSCRWLSERLVEAWQDSEKSIQGAPMVTPYATASMGRPEETIIPEDSDERLAYARRLICDRCLYGVDKNPMAVDMAKLSLWLITLDKGRAFTFLDHALKSGDSLLGLTSVAQIEKFHVITKGLQIQDNPITQVVRDLFKRACQKRLELESFVVNSIEDSARKAGLLRETREIMEMVSILSDMLLGMAMSTADGEACKRDGMPHKSFETRRKEIWVMLQAKYMEPDTESAREALEKLAEESQSLLNTGLSAGSTSRRPFHWPVEFPEVFTNGNMGNAGFSAIIGNPPFMGGQKITGALGTSYRNYLIDLVAEGRKGSADLCAYFFLQAANLTRAGAMIGLLATNTIAQGDTREVGLDALVEKGVSIPRAVPSRKWPGTANLEVAHVWLRKGEWIRPYVLNDSEVRGISPLLQIPGRVSGNPHRLAANASLSFIGSYVLGMGFVMTPEEAAGLIDKDPRNKDVLYPYLNGEDLNSRPDQSASRWVINFHGWPLRRAEAQEWKNADEKGRKELNRQGIAAPDYNGPVAADYPDCLRIVEEKVKPERAKLNRKVRRERWWQFAERAPQLYSTISGMERVLVRAEVSSFLSYGWRPVKEVYSHMVIVWRCDRTSEFAILQSDFHGIWTVQYASSLGKGIRYTPSDCFETFPFPPALEGLDDISSSYYNHRQSILLERLEGLTKTYNRFHNKSEKTEDIAELRRLHVEMDYAVAAAYGWTDLVLGHGFHETKQGVRYTISEPARMEVLDRLMDLNHERYEEEVRQGLHETVKAGKKKTKSSKKSSGQELSLRF
jgi:hypothetical protein